MYGDLFVQTLLIIDDMLYEFIVAYHHYHNMLIA